MFLHPRSKNRPFHLGAFPLETLPRDDRIVEIEAARPPLSATRPAGSDALLAAACDKYREIFAGFADGGPAPARAPVPDDPGRRAVDIKGGAYFMDAAQVGICRLPANAWLEGVEPLPHDYAIVIMIENGRLPETGNLAREWVAPAAPAAMAMRAAEIAGCIAGHIRNMGFAAHADMDGARSLDWERLAVLAGLGVRRGDGIENPYLDGDFTLAAISTDYALAVDRPLHENALKAKGLAYWWGIKGARSGRECNRRARRATHLSRYPMETVKRIERPTTLIIDDEVPRVPKRAAFFQRALHGDLGQKARVERGRFAFKTPLSFSMLQLIRGMVPHQDGERPAWKPPTRRAAASPRAVKGRPITSPPRRWTTTMPVRPRSAALIDRPRDESIESARLLICGRITGRAFQD